MLWMVVIQILLHYFLYRHFEVSRLLLSDYMVYVNNIFTINHLIITKKIVDEYMLQIVTSKLTDYITAPKLCIESV